MIKQLLALRTKTEIDPVLKERLKIGTAVLILLGMVTVGEFLIGAISPVWSAPLIGAAILKAFFIVRDYMHIGRVFAGEEEHS